MKMAYFVKFAIAVLLISVVWPLIHRQASSQKRIQLEDSVTEAYFPSQPPNPILITTNGFSAAIFQKSGMRVNFKIITPGVWWAVRFDKDYRRVRTMPAINYSSNVIQNFDTPATLIDFKIIPRPGESVAPITEAYVVYEITKDNGPISSF